MKDKNKSANLEKIIDFMQVLLSYHTDDSILHYEQVKTYTKILAVHYNRLYPEKKIPRRDFIYLLLGAELHDIGKICISDRILNQKGKLSDDEFDLIKKHPVNGANIINMMADIYKLGPERKILTDICRYHHERYDGTGYPEGLAGDKIPFYAQIVSIAEVYSALTEENYREAMSHEEAIKEILSGKCGKFNPVLMECLRHASDNLNDTLVIKDDANRLSIVQKLDITRKSNYWKWKRYMDIAISAGVLTIFSPLYLVIALMVVMDDPKGGPFYAQQRLGRHRKPFKMYKFRTMYKDADKRLNELASKNEKDGPVFKMKNDPRVTRFGVFLRKTGLDELPQFFNVLKGDMSIVGPRPPLAKEVAEYSRYHEIRLSVTPGITCTWQIQPHRDTIGFEEWMDMDVAYIATRSLSNDLKIMLRTFFTIINRSGS